MSHFRADIRQRAEELVALYPRKRSAMLPLLHLAQEQDGYLSDEGIAEVAALTDTTPADVRGTASFYDMFHLEPVGKYVVGVCTNIACLLAGGEELLEHAATTLGCAVGATSSDGMFTLEETECLADCNQAPCVQVNHRYVRTTTPAAFDAMVTDLREGRLDHDVPTHGTLIRVKRQGGLRVAKDDLAAERAAALAARTERAEAAEAAARAAQEAK
ncbi:MAG: NAD(P)H-dependent oxidoreductase subunit E [Acidobacteriota bacterium]|nr:NAD(P)H-dependent oxidoreductase subunit E [Acidobacteriota bacterium]MDE3138347.1 NAD(P)H-dependent oxidoreductase subunit E [Acidobacteriota bacterium]MDE3145964.1 NAD(P)H-dependent oxidoreductase subunit E [Acidobacteriota bacterium]